MGILNADCPSVVKRALVRFFLGRPLSAFQMQILFDWFGELYTDW